MVDNLGISDVGNGTKPLNMLDAVSSLKEAGFEQEQAEAVVRMQSVLLVPIWQQNEILKSLIVLSNTE